MLLKLIWISDTHSIVNEWSSGLRRSDLISLELFVRLITTRGYFFFFFKIFFPQFSCFFKQMCMILLCIMTSFIQNFNSEYG